ncbi:TOBE domain-containing protein [Desulfofustis glycolicus]|uniref:Molybdate transport system regulatory protein n=1 Tax=Desulfofustis glycolicus DSM 9705 TaxID=1121409 RepID=A0A1M5V720_9BACT|nr:TOBE domain-containing protein [Desulfofustis glycolicus]SHH71059.1 molybdate transport system regulatory protein [Desulfofustis glycolicus DSM 9705]
MDKQEALTIHMGGRSAKKTERRVATSTAAPSETKQAAHRGRSGSSRDDSPCLDSVQLGQLEQSFCQWQRQARRTDQRRSRSRLLLVFLLIRYTGAKLNEVLMVQPNRDFDWERSVVCFCSGAEDDVASGREVHLSKTLAAALRDLLDEPTLQPLAEQRLQLDPGFVRRKFYERTVACGFAKRLGGPEMLRKARATELLQGNMPLPAVQMMLGHSSPSLTSSYVSFSAEEIRSVARHFLEREDRRRTSARNTFFGKVETIRRGTIQSLVVLATIDGFSIATVITNDSLERLGLCRGRLLTAEVKAPLVMLQAGEEPPLCSADNRLKGSVVAVTPGPVTSECVVRVSEGVEVCAIISSAQRSVLDLRVGMAVWVLFSCFAVVLQADD